LEEALLYHNFLFDEDYDRFIREGFQAMAVLEDT
jgi:hypothetical protein